MWPHPDDSLLPGQSLWGWRELQVLVQSPGGAVQESITRPVVVPIRERAIVVAVVVDSVRDAFDGPGPRQ